MSSLAISAAAAPLVLGVAFTLARYEGRRQRRRAAASNTRSLDLRLDPSLDLLFLAEATLPNSLACLTALTRPGVQGVTLRAARLELLPEAPCTAPQPHSPTLTALESGSCFVSALHGKIEVAAFTAADVHPGYIDLRVLGRPNLLDYLRADWFTVELSGTHRRRLTRPLPLRMQLELEVQEQVGALA
ncbi:hypothetical protein [Hymenobacter sp. B81]|uniref:hypothetical protein n=1 Tax=Hymenobacter sp. B81 TaxID=3344878 RepID=UPI0037DD7EF2